MSQLDSKKQIVPQEIITDGSASTVWFTIKSPTGATLFSIKGDGTVAGSSAQQAKLTAGVIAAASFTFTAPGADDYAFGAMTSTTPFGFANANEANSALKALQNAILRIEQLEARLTAAGILSAT